MPEDKLFQVGQKAVIERDGKILVLLWRNQTELDLPGGRIQVDETDLAPALQREVREETGLEIEVGVPFATWLGRGNTVYLVAYRCRYLSGEVILSEEHDGFRWVGKDDYRDLDDGRPHFAALRQVFENEAL